MNDLSEEELALIKDFRDKKIEEQEFIIYLNNFKSNMDPILFEMYSIKELYYEFIEEKKLEKLSKYEDEAWDQYGKDEYENSEPINGWK